jgi:prepilin signal peptidase PulO-like enzyme (type II secretory pathway)
MGAGDPKLLGALGIWLGWQALPVALLGASVIGLLLISITGSIAGHSRTAFPFGSYLGVAAFLAALIGWIRKRLNCELTDRTRNNPRKSGFLDVGGQQWRSFWSG